MTDTTMNTGAASLLPCPFCGGEAKSFEESLDERFAYANKITIRCSACDDLPKGMKLYAAPPAQTALTAAQKWEIAERVHAQCERLKPHATFRSAASQAINDTLEALYTSAQSEGWRKDAVPDGVEVAAYYLTDSTDVTVQRIGQRIGHVTGPDLWAVRQTGNCLNKDGEWECEPMPSSRSADFLARCRFASAQEAIDAAIRALSQKEPQ